jgi:hypothetical protein
MKRKGKMIHIDSKGWGWKIVFDCTSDSAEFLDADLISCDRIPEFLECYCNWEQRLDLEKLPRKV